MIANLIGYALDSAGADPRTAQPITIPAGETGNIGITVKHRDGTTYDITGCRLLLTVRRGGIDYITKWATIDNAAAGTAHWTTSDFDTSSLSGGYAYDVQLTLVDNITHYQIIPPLAFFSVTEAEGTSSTTVTAGPALESIAISPTSPTMAIGHTVQLTATGTYSDLTTLNITSAVTWSTGNASIATISNGTTGGVLLAVGPGSTAVSATLGGISASTTATIQGSLVRISGTVPNTTFSTGPTNIVYHRPFYIPSDVQSLHVRMGNRHPINGGYGTGITCDVAVYKSDGSGHATGSPLAKWTNQAIPGDGTDWVSPTAVPIAGNRGTDGKIVLLHGWPASSAGYAASPVVWGGYSTGTLTVDPPPASASDNSPPLWIHLEYNTSRPRLVVLGDSIGIGCTSVSGFEASAWYMIGTQRDYSVCLVGMPGANLGEWAAFNTNPAFWSDVLLTGSIDVWIELCVNSLSTGAAQMETDLTTIVNHLRSIGSIGRIMANTCAPQTYYAGVETARTTYNADLLGTFGWTDAGHVQAYALVTAIV